MITALRRLLVALAASFAILVGTGIYLAFRYRPSTAIEWDDLESAGDTLDLLSAIRTIHRVSAFVFVVLALVTAVTAVIVSMRSRWSIGALGVVGLALAVTFVVSGYFLPWDQLGLWAVTVGTNLEGYKVVFQDNVKFVALNGHEFGPEVIQRWFVAHAIVLPVAVIAVGIALPRLSHRGERRVTSPAISRAATP